MLEKLETINITEETMTTEDWLKLVKFLLNIIDQQENILTIQIKSRRDPDKPIVDLSTRSGRNKTFQEVADSLNYLHKHNFTDDLEILGFGIYETHTGKFKVYDEYVKTEGSDSSTAYFKFDDMTIDGYAITSLGYLTIVHEIEEYYSEFIDSSFEK